MAKPLAFVLMPFDEVFDEVYEHLIARPLDEAGFDVKRADSDLNQRNILQDVVRGIADAQLVIADVTGLNGNVLYELGLAHGLGKPTVMLTQEIGELPFDLRPYRAQEYSTFFSRAHLLAEHLTAVGHGVLEGSIEFSNPVQDFAPDVAATPSRSSATAARPVLRGQNGEDGGGEQVDEDVGPGLFDKMVEAERAQQEMLAAVELISAETEAVGDLVKKHSERLEEARRRLGDRSSPAFLTITRDAAKDLDKYRAAIEPLVDTLGKSLTLFVEVIDMIARFGTIEDEESVRKAEKLLQTLEVLEQNIQEASDGTSNFAMALLTVPHVSKQLTSSSRKTGHLVERISETLVGASAEISRTRALIAERLDGFK